MKNKKTIFIIIIILVLLLLGGAGILLLGLDKKDNSPSMTSSTTRIPTTSKTASTMTTTTSTTATTVIMSNSTTTTMNTTKMKSSTTKKTTEKTTSTTKNATTTTTNKVTTKKITTTTKKVDKPNENKEELVPSVPTISKSYTTEDSITINFDASTNAKAYSCSTENIKGIITFLPDGKLQCNIKGLTNGTKYDVTLEAQNVNKKNSTKITLTTQYKQPDISKMLNSNVTDSNIQINFEVVNYAKSYSCYYKKKTDKEYSNQATTVIDNTVYCDIKNLEENTEYEIYLKAVNGDKSSLSNIITLKTDIIEPEKPAVSKISKTSDSITLEISKPKNAESISCDYGISTNKINLKGKVEEDNDKYICKLKGLDANTTYYVQLISIRAVNNTNSTEIIEIKTNDYETPGKSSLISNTIKTSSIDLLFSVADNAKSYEIYYGKDKNNLVKKDGEITNAGIKVTIDNLDIGVIYFVKIVSINNNKKNESDFYEVTIEDIIPDKPTFIGKNSTEKSIEVYFNKANNAKYYSCYYGTNEGELSILGNVSVLADSIKCSIDSLTQNETYYVKLVAVNNSKSTDSEIISITTSYATPEKPILNSNEIGVNTLKLIYSKPEYTTDYTCYYGINENSMDNTVIGTVSNNEIICNMTGLTEGTKYFVKLVVSNNSIKTNESDISTLTTDYKNPDTPTLESIDSTSNSIIANYVITDDNLEYVCHLEKDSIEIMNVVATLNSKIAQCSLNGLDENTEYNIQLSATNNTKTTYSAKSLIRTKNEIPTMPVLENSVVTDASATLTYNNVNNKYTYACTYGTDINTTTSIGEITINGASAICDIDNLTSNKNYYVKFTAINGTETSEITSMIKTSLAKPSKPVFVSNIITDNSIEAIFSIGENPANYICYYGIDEVDNIGTVTTTSTQVTCTMAGLEQNTTYKYKLVASNNDEISVESDIQTVTTEYLTPGKPVMKTNVSDTKSITVTYQVSGVFENMSCKYGSEITNLTNTAVAARDLAGNIICQATNLDSDTSYYFQLTLTNGNKTNSSDIEIIRTENISLKAPEYINSTIYRTRIRANFSLIPNVYGYTCLMGESESNLTNSVNSQITDEQVICEFNNLRSGATYYFQLIAQNAAGQESYSDIIPLTTIADVAEKPVLSEQHNWYNKSLTIWNISGTYTQEACYASKDGTNYDISGGVAFHGDDVLCMFYNLEPNTEYYIKMINTNLDASEEAITQIKTLEKANNLVSKEEMISSDGQIIPAVYINQTGGASSVFADEYEEANTMTEFISAYELQKTLADYYELGVVQTVGHISIYYTSDYRVGAIHLNIDCYNRSGALIGNYYLDDNGERQWTFKNF